MEWNPEQDRLLTELVKFCRDPSRKIFQVVGRAGTGKTTLVREVRDRCDELAFIALAYTGKAASRLRAKGWPNASTIHSKLYLPGMQSRARLRAWVLELEMVCEKLSQDEVEPGAHARQRAEQADLKKKIADEELALKDPVYIYNQETVLKDYDIIVVDEVSMLGDTDGANLMKVCEEGGVKIILLGDYNQLPPVKSRAYFQSFNIDFTLTQIMRQEKDNPIIWIADYILQHRKCPPLGSYGNSSIVKTLSAQSALDADQFILGKNETRAYYNRRMRELRGYTDVLEVGEKLICLANDKKEGFFNGTMWYVQEVYGVASTGDKIDVRISSDDADEGDRETFIWIKSLEGHDIPWMERQGAQCMVAAQAVTVHKFQGSEAKKVQLLDQSWCARADAYRWLYTGATRAQEELCIAMGET